MDEYKKSNRHKHMTPKKTEVWCRCDRELVNLGGEKCTVCGRRGREKKRRLKKEPI